jgi:hypothetical protein
MQKHVRYDDWKSDWIGREGNDDELKIKVYPGKAPDDDSCPKGFEFLVVPYVSEAKLEASVSLYVQMPLHKRPHVFCRYDLQHGKHTNPKWFKPRAIKPREPHRHVYNPRAVRQGLPTDWHNCAEPITGNFDGSFVARLRELQTAFLNDMKIDFFDKGAQRALFRY